ncbi:MAG: hypothetical protein AMXMBFR78_24250 [Rubrivivax sp.]
MPSAGGHAARMSLDLPALPGGARTGSSLDRCAVPGSIRCGIVQPGSPVADGAPIIRVSNFSPTDLELSEVMRVAPEVEATRLTGAAVMAPAGRAVIDRARITCV